MSNALTPSFRCESVLEGGCGLFHFLGNLLRNRSCDQPPQNISHDDPPHPSVWFAYAVIRPKRMASMISSGTFPTASSELTWTNKSHSTSLSKTRNRWSDVIPDGPGAAPRRAFLKQVRSSNGSNSDGLRGSDRRIS